MGGGGAGSLFQRTGGADVFSSGLQEEESADKKK